MKTGLHQTVRLGQELRINPRLYQAMDMLYMPLLDLQQHLKQELLVNPFLELTDEEEEEGAASESESLESTEEVAVPLDESPPTADEDQSRWEEILLEGFEPDAAQSEAPEARERFEPVPVASRDLADHLRDQVQLLDLTPRQMLLAEEFIGNIGDDGYLTATPEQILQGVNEVIVQAVCAEDAAEACEAHTQDVAEALRRRGVPARANVTAAPDASVADELLAEAAARGADLIVMGAYGHSRMAEWVFGGVTRTVLADPQVYLLLSH